MRTAIRKLTVACAILVCWLMVPVCAFADVIDPSVVVEPSSSAPSLFAPVAIVALIAALFIVRRRRQ